LYVIFFWIDINLIVCCNFQANCIDSTISAKKVYEREVAKLREDELKAREMIEIDTYERNHAVVVGTYRKQKKEPLKS